MRSFEYSSIPGGSLVKAGASVTSAGPGWLPSLASLVLVETARGVVLLFAASAAYEDKSNFWDLALAYNMGRILSIAFLSYVVSLGSVSALLYLMNSVLVMSLGALFGGCWAPAAVLVAGLASGSSPAVVASVLASVPDLSSREPPAESCSANRTNAIRLYKAVAVIVAVQHSMFASGPLLASIVFSAAARLAPLLWPQLSVLLLLCVLSLGVSATVWAWVQRQELGVSIRENSPGPNALPPTRALKRKPSSFRAGGSNARLDDLEALNPAGRAAKAAVETYEAITEIANIDHLFLLAEPLYIALAHAVQHRVAFVQPSAAATACVAAAAAALLASLGCVTVAADRSPFAGLRGYILEAVPCTATLLCIVSGLSIGGMLLIATLMYSSAPPLVLISFDAILRLLAEPCVRWGVLASACCSALVLGPVGGANEEWEQTRALLFKRIQFQLSLVSIICFVTQMIMHS